MAEPAQRSRDAPAGEADLPCLDLLSQGALEIVGRLVEASNATMYATVRHAGRQATCVYKPVAGERPLWDFPTGSLAGREVAAYQVSRAAGWNLVPPTVMRDGPFGPGMCQLWIDCDPSVDLIALARSTGNPSLREMAVFDAVVNNADRKAGHLLPATAGRLRPRRLFRRGVQAPDRALAVARPAAAAGRDRRASPARHRVPGRPARGGACRADLGGRDRGDPSAGVGASCPAGASLPAGGLAGGAVATGVASTRPPVMLLACQPLPRRGRYRRLRSRSRSSRLPATLICPRSQARPKLDGSAATFTTTSLSAVNRTCAAGSPGAASLTGAAPSGGPGCAGRSGSPAACLT